MNKANRKHAATRSIALHFAFHPVFVVGALIEYYNYFALFEVQFVIVVGITIVQRTATVSITRLQCSPARNGCTLEIGNVNEFASCLLT